MTPEIKKALDLALEALESCDQVYGSEGSYQYFSQVMVDKAITVARQALEQPVQEPRWYFVDKTGVAILCTDEDDAKQGAKQAEKAWPRFAPYRAVQLCEYTTPPAPAPAPVQPAKAPKEYTMGNWFNDLENPHGNR